MASARNPVVSAPALNTDDLDGVAAAVPHASPAAAPRNGADEDLRRQWQAFGSKYDMQTGLLNPQWFQQSMEMMLREFGPEQGVAVLWIDLLNLHKEFNTSGWSGAKALVSHVAGTLRSAMDEDGLISRFSRSFVVCVRASKSDPGVRRRFKTLMDAITGPVSEYGMNPEISAGVAFYPEDAESAEDLARYASLAADVAAQRGLRGVLPFQPGMNSRIMREHEMEREIEKALDCGQIEMFYQPKVDLVSGHVVGAEALMRWTHPVWGEVPPAEFIPIAERSQLIHRIFDFSLRAALEDAQRWSALGIAPAIIAVNVSAANLRLDDIQRRVQALMAEFPIHPVQLELELTESLLLDDEELFTTRIRQLKDIGVRVAIDDFGTRYTGFDVLKRLPFDSMKIDRCFIRGIHRSPDLRTLCNTIVAMGRHMKLRTVAEGIEEAEELEVLQQIGCDVVQGFLLQRPVSAGDLTAFLQHWPKRSCSFGFSPQSEHGAIAASSAIA